MRPVLFFCVAMAMGHPVFAEPFSLPRVCYDPVSRAFDSQLTDTLHVADDLPLHVQGYPDETGPFFARSPCGSFLAGAENLTVHVGVIRHVTKQQLPAMDAVMRFNRGWLHPDTPADWYIDTETDALVQMEWLFWSGENVRRLIDAQYYIAQTVLDVPGSYLRCADGICQHWMWVDDPIGQGHAILALEYAHEDRAWPGVIFEVVEARARDWFMQASDGFE